MCTAVVGGSIQRAATSRSAANNQRRAIPMRIHVTKDRRESLRLGGFGWASEFSVTFQNNRFAPIDIVLLTASHSCHYSAATPRYGAGPFVASRKTHIRRLSWRIFVAIGNAGVAASIQREASVRTPFKTFLS